MTEQQNNSINPGIEINPNQDAQPAPEQTQYQKNRDRHIKIIMDTALCPTLPNGLSRTLTYIQAGSILLRSIQLAREGNFHSYAISPVDKKEQIEICYRQRRSQRQ